MQGNLYHLTQYDCVRIQNPHPVNGIIAPATLITALVRLLAYAHLHGLDLLLTCNHRENGPGITWAAEMGNDLAAHNFDTPEEAIRALASLLDEECKGQAAIRIRNLPEGDFGDDDH